MHEAFAIWYQMQGLGESGVVFVSFDMTWGKCGRVSYSLHKSVLVWYARDTHTVAGDKWSSYLQAMKPRSISTQCDYSPRTISIHGIALEEVLNCNNYVLRILARAKLQCSHMIVVLRDRLQCVHSYIRLKLNRTRMSAIANKVLAVEQIVLCGCYFSRFGDKPLLSSLPKITVKSRLMALFHSEHRISY